jgi:hypothetical protein
VISAPPLVAYAGGRVWFAWRDNIWRINPATNAITKVATTVDYATGLAADDAAGWTETGSGTVYRTDVRTGENIRTANISGGNAPTDIGATLGPIATGEGAVWGSGTAGLLWKLDPFLGNPVRSVDVRADTRADTSPVFVAIAVGDKSVWNALYDNAKQTGTITKVETPSNRATIRIPFPNIAEGIAVGEGAVWVSSHR